MQIARLFQLTWMMKQGRWMRWSSFRLLNSFCLSHESLPLKFRLPNYTPVFHYILVITADRIGYKAVEGVTGFGVVNDFPIHLFQIMMLKR